jgi:hypothetical protein
MSQSVNLSDDLVNDARQTAEAAGRSIAEQIEFWATLGRALEPLLDGSRPSESNTGAPEPLSKCFARVNTAEGRKRLADYLDSTPFPHYEPIPGEVGMLVRVDADGTRTTGRYFGSELRPVK